MEPIEKHILQYLKEYAQDLPNEVFLFDDDGKITAKELFDYVQYLGVFLKENGAKHQQFIGMCGARSKEAIAIFLATQTLGAVAVLCDPRQEVRECVASTGVSLTIDHAINLVDGKWMFDEVVVPTIKEAKNIPDLEWDINVHEPSTIIFTSGSTGRAKGVILTQHNYINHIRNIAPVAGFSEKDSSIQLLPIFHIFGIDQFHDAIIHRVPIYFTKEITPESLCIGIEKYKATRAGIVPSMALAMCKLVEEKGYDTSSLITLIMGGASSTKEQLIYIQNTLKATILPTYGMSECTGGITQAGPWESDEDRATSVGKPLPMNMVEISPVGEILVKGPGVFYGYVGEEPFDHSQFFHTGDLGYFDDRGFLHITGRIKDIIIRNGNNISAPYLESQLLSLPFILEAAVVGLPDKDVGEVPGAMIVIKPGCSYDEEALRSKFNKLEMPTTIKIVDKIPLTASGKADKQKIKEILGH